MEARPKQGSTLRPVGSPMRLDFIQSRLTFHAWLPGWPPRYFNLVLKFLIEFNTLILSCSYEANEIVFVSPFGYFI